MSDITSISDAFVESYARLLPELASDDGITDHDDKWRDWSLDGLEAQRDLYRDGQAKARSGAKRTLDQTSGSGEDER